MPQTPACGIFLHGMETGEQLEKPYLEKRTALFFYNSDTTCRMHILRRHGLSDCLFRDIKRNQLQ
jgi:hypothetical protein